MLYQILLEQIPRAILVVGLVLLSGMISAGETALFALSRHQLTRLRRSSTTGAELALRLRERPESLLSTILLANIAVNILLFSMLTVMVRDIAGGSPVAATAAGLITFVLVLLFAEIIPKLVAYSNTERLAPLIAYPVRFLEMFTFPLRRIFEICMVEPLTRIICGAGREAPQVRAEELQRLVTACQSEGLVDERETRLLQRTMEIAHTKVRAVMVPRVDLVAFDLGDDPARLVELIRRHRLLRIPVYDGDIDHVRGAVLAKEFLMDPTRSVRTLIRPVHFVPEQASIEALLRHFRTTGSQQALVVDEYGGVAGIVALEDAVEALVGEMHAPGEEVARPPFEQLDAVTFGVDGGLSADEFCEAFGIRTEPTRVQTLGGLIAAVLDRVPIVGDKVRIGPAVITVETMSRRRVTLARVVFDQPPARTAELVRLLERSRATVPAAVARKGQAP